MERFSRGIIEGFFGRVWSWQTRYSYAQFLKQYGYQYYIYAPKADRYLRRHWSEPWPEEDFAGLQRLACAYRDAGVDWGIGLTPFEIRDFDAATKAKLDDKLQAIASLEPDILAILFDDMRGDQPDLVRTQVDITHYIRDRSRAKSLIMCPTYYSTDPVLDKVFGNRPLDYLETMGRSLDGKIDIFWTGEKVCSKTYPAVHLQDIAERLGRKPFIWDNYPVNDGAKICKFLHLRPFDESVVQLSQWASGHAINPMNQAYLSQIPILALTAGGVGSTLYDAACCLGGELFASYLVKDVADLQDRGLDVLTSAEKTRLIDRYAPLDIPYSRELVDWLQGQYPFDPACLTD